MQIFFGVLIGFLISFFSIRRSVRKAGYGQMKVCRETCPYFRTAFNNVVSDEDG